MLSIQVEGFGSESVLSSVLKRMIPIAVFHLPGKTHLLRALHVLVEIRSVKTLEKFWVQMPGQVGGYATWVH